MKQFHGANKQHSFFEGWYLKQQNQEETIALIPSIHINAQGERMASLQVIEKEQAFAVTFPAEVFRAAADRFCIKMHKNLFTERGCVLDVDREELQLKGALHFYDLTPLKGDIMGPFRHVPFMQCNHGILSLAHGVSGRLLLNGRLLRFDHDLGYIEKDWGSSFPKEYFWTQCNWRHWGNCCVMMSVAHIPFLGSSFTGVIALVYYGGKQYRLATYSGVKILTYNAEEVALQQGHFMLQAQLLEQEPQKLKAPQLGGMNRMIHESAASVVRYRFYIDGRLLFEHTSHQAGYEWVRDTAITKHCITEDFLV